MSVESHRLHIPDTQVEPPVTIIDWPEAAARVGSLEAGDIITGFVDPDDLDIFVHNVGNWLGGEPPNLNLTRKKLLNKGHRIFVDWTEGSRLPSDAMQPRFGYLQDISVVMLDYKRSEEEAAAGIDRKRLLIAANVTVRGRPVAGKIANKCTISGQLYPSGQRRGSITAAYREIPSLSLRALNSVIQEESSESAGRAIRVFYGGSPGSQRHKRR